MIFNKKKIFLLLAAGIILIVTAIISWPNADIAILNTVHLYVPGVPWDWGKSYCEQRGGRVNNVLTSYKEEEGIVRTPICYLPYKDAGKPCTNARDCQGECLVVSPQIPFQESLLPPNIDPQLKVLDADSCKKIDMKDTRICDNENFVGKCSMYPSDVCVTYWTIVEPHVITPGKMDCVP
jgi:putative hemolysin